MYANKNKTKNSKSRTVARGAESTKLSSTDSRYDAGDYEAVPASIRKIRDARNKELEEQNAIPAEEIIARQEAEIAELKRQAAAGSAPQTMADKYRSAVDDLEDHPTFKNPESMADFGDYEAVASSARLDAESHDPNQKVFRAKPTVSTRKVAAASDLSPGDYEAVAAAARHAVPPDEFKPAPSDDYNENEEYPESQDNAAPADSSEYVTDAEAARASRPSPSREVPEYTAPAPEPEEDGVHSEPYTPPITAAPAASSDDVIHSEPYTPPIPAPAPVSAADYTVQNYTAPEPKPAPAPAPAPVSAEDYTVQNYTAPEPEPAKTTQAPSQSYSSDYTAQPYTPPAQRAKYSDDGNYDVGGPVYSQTSGRRIASVVDIAPGDYEAVAASSYDDSDMDLADGSYDFDKYLAGAPSLQMHQEPAQSPEEAEWADLGTNEQQPADDVDITDEQTRMLTEAIAQETLQNQPGTKFEDIIDKVIAKVKERKEAEAAAKAAPQQEQPEPQPQPQQPEQKEPEPQPEKAEQPAEEQPEEKPAEPQEPEQKASDNVITPSTPIEDIPALIVAQLDSADGSKTDDDIRKSIDAALIGKLTTGELTLDSVQTVRNKILDEIHEMQEEEARILAELEGKPEKHPFDPNFLSPDIAVDDIPDAVIAELDNIDGEVADDDVKQAIDRVMIVKLSKGELTLDSFEEARNSIFDTLGIETTVEQAEEPEPKEEPAKVEEPETEPEEPEPKEEPTPTEEPEPEKEPAPTEKPETEESEPVEETEPQLEEEPEEPIPVEETESQPEEEPAPVEEYEPVEEPAPEIVEAALAEQKPAEAVEETEAEESAENSTEESAEPLEEPIVEEETEEAESEEPAEPVEEPAPEEPVEEVEPETTEEPVEETAGEPAEEPTTEAKELAAEQSEEDEEEEEQTIPIPVPKEPTVLEYDPYEDKFVNPTYEPEEPENSEESAEESAEPDEAAEEPVESEEVTEEPTEAEEPTEEEETPLSAAAVLAMQNQDESVSEEEPEGIAEGPAEEPEEEPEPEAETESEREAEEEPEAKPEAEEPTEEPEPEVEEPVKEPETEAEEPVEEAEPRAEEELVEEQEQETEPKTEEPVEKPEAEAEEETSEESDSDILDRQITFDDILRNPFVNDFEPMEPFAEAPAATEEPAEDTEPEPEDEEPVEEPADEPEPVAEEEVEEPEEDESSEESEPEEPVEEPEPEPEESESEAAEPAEEAEPETETEEPPEEAEPESEAKETNGEAAEEPEPVAEEETEEPKEVETEEEPKAEEAVEEPSEENAEEDAEESKEEEPAEEPKAEELVEEPAEEPAPVEESAEPEKVPEEPDEYAEAKEKRHEGMQNALLMAMIDDKEKTFSDAVNYMIDQDDLNARTLRSRMPINKEILDRVIKESDFVPDKKTAIAICFALRLTWEDTVRLLYKGGYSLNDYDRYDLTIEYLLRRGVYDQNMINSVLLGSGLEGFGTPQSEI